MIARHSLEQSGDGEGVEVVENKSIQDAEHGHGQYTEKRIHLSKWVKYLVEWNYSYFQKEFGV